MARKLVGPVSRPRSRARSEAGFTLLEVVVAMGILSVALLSLVGVFATGLRRVGSSSNQLIAREKAREAIESVHAARDTGRVSWDSVRNVADGGIFLPGALPLTKPGADGIVGTADDGAVETVRKPGPDGILGNTDDEIVTLTNFSREVILTPLNFPNTANVNLTLRQVTVNIRYLVENTWQTYTLTTYVSSFS